MLSNQACPNELSFSHRDEEDYQRYRYVNAKGILSGNMILCRLLRVIRPSPYKRFFRVKQFRSNLALPLSLGDSTVSAVYCEVLMTRVLQFIITRIFFNVFFIRYYVLYRLPKLTFLDSRPVKQDERDEAQRVGAHMKIMAPSDEDLISNVSSKHKQFFSFRETPQ